MAALALQVSWASPDEYLTAFNAEISRGGLLVRGASLVGVQAGAEVVLSASVTGGGSAQVSARVAAVVPGVGVAVMFTGGVPEELKILGSPVLEAEVLLMEEEEEDEEEVKGPPGPLSERLKKMTVTEKMQLALTGTRDERMALFRDTNKSLHIFVLKNPRIGLDEIQGAAKSPNVSPDALKMIAEHREWGSNAIVAASLVRNPKTPMPLAMRMLEKVPMSELKAIAKGGARDQLVHAARKKLAG
ncbi:MAG: hypothetical protein Q8N23_08600 [Archangium sp.]|nr:hypothetical protein [Archangium sp.]MDP3152715.1 hypothetical protein [Archangium sp.]MDP3573503.1 hypothetical protein [Archangium sp.]